jgi:hypothetical protein
VAGWIEEKSPAYLPETIYFYEAHDHPTTHISVSVVNVEIKISSSP